MRIWTHLTKALCALALMSGLAAPAAFAERERAHRGDYRHHGYSYKYEPRYGHWDKRHWKRDRHQYRDRHHWRHHTYRHRHHHRPHYRHLGYRDHWRYYKHPPRYHPRYTYRPPAVERWHNRHHYKPRYRIGGYYHYHPRTVILTHYGHYGLHHPPYGYHWVRDPGRGDAILASIATGAILGIAIGVLAD